MSASAIDPAPILEAAFWMDEAAGMSFLRSGRSALKLALLACRLRGDDHVLIITTTGGRYVSSCVTQEIEKICAWSHVAQPNTKAVVVIHEFGIPCERIEEVRELGVPVIEDCAYGAGTRIAGGAVGNFGDFVLYSLPKYFPLPFGGILAGRKVFDVDLVREELPSPQSVALMKKCLLHAGPLTREWNRKRRENWQYFASHCCEKGRAFFELADNTVPGAYVSTLSPGTAGSAVKMRCVQNGIESTEYYGMGGFYFPVHQFLTDFERDYILHHYLQGHAL